MSVQTSGKIADVQGTRLQAWQPEAVLYGPDPNEVRYSRGFLRCRPEVWFDALASHWLPFFHTLGAGVSLTAVRTSLDFPESLERVTPVEFDGEPAIIGLDRTTLEHLIDLVCPGAQSAGLPGAAALAVIEYLERRLLSTLSLSWNGGSAISCFFIPPERTEAVEVVGTVAVELSIQKQSCVIYFGLGPRMLERLDLSWREFVREQASAQRRNATTPRVGEGELSSVSVELVELAVPPAMVIDYVRSGTVIRLGVPANGPVVLRAGGEMIAAGELVQCNGRFAVQISSVEARQEQISNSTTRVQIEIAATELDHESLGEYLQPGAILLTRTPVSPTAAMVISGETVASALIGEIDGELALQVLPK